jgi:hypothetical protein
MSGKNDSYAFSLPFSLQGMSGYGQAASGGSDIRIASALPPVLSPNWVLRS